MTKFNGWAVAGKIVDDELIIDDNAKVYDPTK